jgi:outer membrane protein assembly factor BamB
MVRRSRLVGIECSSIGWSGASSSCFSGTAVSPLWRARSNPGALRRSEYAGAGQRRVYRAGSGAGQQLWKFKTASGINSPPITYTHNGRQYVTVLSGIGGVLNRVMKVADRVPTGGSVWTFALMPE